MAFRLHPAQLDVVRPGHLYVLLALTFFLWGCSGGGDSGSLTPQSESVGSPDDNTRLEETAAQNLLDLYRTAIQAEDIDRLTDLLAGDGEAVGATSFRDVMTATLRRFSIIDLHLTDVTLQPTAEPFTVAFRESLSVIDPAPGTWEQRTRSVRTTWRLARQTSTTGIVMLLIAAVSPGGPEFEVVMRGRVVAGQPTRVEVRETTGAFPIVGGEVVVPETGAVQALTWNESRWHAVITVAAGPDPEPLQVRLRGAGGEAIEVPHRYRLHRPGVGLGQVVAGTVGIPFRAVVAAPDGNVWGGGGQGGILMRVTPGAATASVVGHLLADPDGQVEDLVLDQLGRLHALVFAPSAGGDIVLDQGRFCQTVNVFNPAYPLRVADPGTGTLQPSASTRGVAAGGGDVWLFGSDGGVTRVTDAFREGQCPADGAGVRYEPMFRRGETGLLSNTVPAFRVGSDGALWFGTAVGLTRLVGSQFTPVLFQSGLAVGGDVATLEAFFQEVARAVFNARPLTSVAIGGVSFVERFGRPLIKEDLIFSLAEDGRGGLWVGTLGGGLRRVEVVNGVPRDNLHLTRQGGLGSNLVLALAVGPDGAVWAATEEGVSRLQDGLEGMAITTFTALDGLPTPVRDVAVVEDGTLWLATDGGLFRLISQGGVLRGVVLDARGQPVVGAEVVLDSMPYRAVTDAAGRYVLVDVPPGPAHLVVDSSLAAGGPLPAMGQDVEVTLGEQTLAPLILPPAGSLQFIQASGDDQVGVVGRPLPQPLVVAVRDEQDRPVSGIPVTFQVLQGGGTVFPAMVATGADGQAATTVTLGAMAGPVEVQVEAPGLLPVTFSATGITVQLIIVSGDRQVGAPGEVLPEPLVVQLADQFGNPLVLAEEPVTATIVQGDGVLLLAPPLSPSARVRRAFLRQASEGSSATVPTDAQGRAVFRLQVGAMEGTIIVEVAAPQLPQTPPVQFLAIGGLVAPIVIAVETSGQLVVLDGTTNAVVRVKPISGTRTIVSDATTGTGQLLDFPQAIAVEADGQLVVVDPGFDAVVRVDPRTGDRMILSSCSPGPNRQSCRGESIGRGPPFDFPRDIAVEADGHLVVVNGRFPGAVVRVDPISGDRTIVSGCPDLRAGPSECGADIGRGPPFEFANNIAVEASGHLVVLNSFFDDRPSAIVRVDPVSGDRTIVSDATTGRGPPFASPGDIAVEAAGHLVVLGPDPFDLTAVVRVDPVSGDRTIISGCAAVDDVGECIGGMVGSGMAFESLTGIAMEADGQLVVVDFDLAAVLRVDPRSGDRIIVSGCTEPNLETDQCIGTIVGEGPSFANLQGIAVGVDGRLMVVDPGRPAVVRVDPVSGDRTIISGCAAVDDVGECIGGMVGNGPSLLFPETIAVEGNGSLAVAENGRRFGPVFIPPSVIRVDPVSGNRTIISGCAAVDDVGECVGGMVGNGPPFVSLSSIAVEADGHLVVLDGEFPGAVVRVHSVTGDRTLVSGGRDARGGGPPLRIPLGTGDIAVEANGQLVVVDAVDFVNPGNAVVLRVDPVSGNRAIVSNPTTGRGLAFVFPQAIAVEADGQLVVVDGAFGLGLQAVVRVDPSSGNRTLISR